MSDNEPEPDQTRGFTVKLTYKGKSVYVDDMTYDTTATELLSECRKNFKVKKDTIIHCKMKSQKIAQEILEGDDIVTYSHPAFDESMGIGRMGAKVMIVGEKKEKKEEKKRDPYLFNDDGLRGRYEGHLDEAGRRQGQGKITQEDGEVYDGEWLNDKRTGFGTCRYANGAVYEGDFLNAKRQGKGTYFCVNGDQYQGEYKANLRDGGGTYLLKNGEKYVGPYKAGKRNGVGVYYWPDGCMDIGHYSGGDDMGDGVRWSKDKSTAWSLVKGKENKEVSLGEAKAIATQMGYTKFK